MARIVMPYAGEDLELNRLEYLQGRIYQQHIDRLADGHGPAGRLHPALKKQLENNIHNIYLLGLRHAATVMAGTTVAAAVKTVLNNEAYNEALINNSIDRTLDHLESLDQQARAQLKAQLREAYFKGESTPKIRDRLQDILDVEKKSANRYARTLTNDVYNQAHLDRYKAEGVEAVQLIASNTERTCDVCAALDGTIWRIDDPSMIRPPTHFNCLLPETRCEAPGGIVAGLRAWYDGPVFELSFASGARISVTPNHMFLTPHGFAAAQLLRLGDDVFYSPDFKGIPSVNPYDDGQPATIEEIVESLAISGGMGTRSMPASPEDLHGDARHINGNIDIIGAYGLLRNAEEPAGFEHLPANDLDTAYLESYPFSRYGRLAQALDILGFAADGGMSGTRQSSPFFRRRLAHPEVHGLAPVTRLNPGLIEAYPDRVSTDAEDSGDRLDRHVRVIESDHFSINSRSISAPNFGSCFAQTLANHALTNSQFPSDIAHAITGLIRTDNVVGINIISYHGYVYDLQTINTLYIGNGLIVSNCRCRLVPWTKGVPGPRSFDEDTEQLIFKTLEDFNKYWNPSALPVQEPVEEFQPATRYSPSGTIAEAEQKAVDMGIADKAMFKGISVEQADDIVQTLAPYKTIAPDALDNINYIGTSQEINKENARLKAEEIAKELRSKGASESFIQNYIKQYVKPRRVRQVIIAETLQLERDNTVIRLGVGVNKNIVTADDFGEILAKDVSSGFHPVGTDSLKAQIDHEMGHVITDTYKIADDQEFNEYYNGLARQDISTGLSRYAAYSKDEFIGEAWSEYRNNPNPRPIALKTGKIIEGIIARNK